jgi:uncharacterized protein (TIGR02217 family)
MSNRLFPDLPGLKINVTRTPVWETLTRKAASGKELRMTLMSSPRWRYKLAYEVLRAGGGFDELQQIAGLFNSCRGSWDNFLYRDPKDRSVLAQQFALGDGVKTQFALVRSYGNFIEPIAATDGAVTIYKAGALQAQPADCSVSSAGVVSFVTAPAVGAALTWSGGFLWRCRFMRDEVDFDQFMEDLWSCGKVEFTTVQGES